MGKKAGEQTADPGVKPQALPQGVDWHKASKPNFVKLKPGEAYNGVFLGVVKTRFGDGYKFQNEEGKIFTIGGNRAQLDSIFQELLGNPQGFIGDTIIGHALIVARETDTQSSQGRKVAVYAIGHDKAHCPKGCK